MSRTRAWNQGALVVGMVAIGAVAGACGGVGETATSTDSEDLIAWSKPCEPLSEVPGMEVERADLDEGRAHVRIGVMNPDGDARADVLFLHGYADRFDNHLPLFEAWRATGLRVIAFDFPSHGETCGQGLDRYKINGVASLAAEVVGRTGVDPARPLLIAGWSTGGLIAVRMIEVPDIAPLGRRVAGAFLLAPAVDVPLVVGDKQFVTLETLTRDPEPPHRGPIAPKSPLNTPLFAADLTLNAHHARRDAYSKDVPTLVVTAGDDDRYVRTRGVVDWVNARADEGARIFGVGCASAKHELDNEIAPVRDDVRTMASAFGAWVVEGAADTPVPSDLHFCTPY